jgi:dihydropteroate synthase-like protein
MANNEPLTGKRILFVTGRLAQHALENELRKLSPEVGIEYEIAVLPITVAALMTPAWIAKKLKVPNGIDRVIVPGYCQKDLSPLIATLPCPVEAGPRDLRKLRQHFGLDYQPPHNYGESTIEIIAEINHAPRLTLPEIITTAKQLASDGADIVDVGCDPGSTWQGVTECVKALRAEDLRVSIDSLNPTEITAAVEAGAELVLSVNSSNRDAAVDWDATVIAIPDDPATLGGLDDTIEFLASHNISLRIDPILEPIGCGFAKSLSRYINVRQRYPDAEMMMGIGNLTELTDCDSAGVNLLLLGICQELAIHSVLTTEVINWSRTSVRECAIARQLVHYAIEQRVPPKHVTHDLVTLRDKELTAFGSEELDRMATNLKDNNYRIFAERGEIHLVSRQLHLSDKDPFVIFEQLLSGHGQSTAPTNLDAAHSFYLGFEMGKALTALTLDKQYNQDQALDWGYLTQEEISHRLTRKKTD